MMCDGEITCGRKLKYRDVGFNTKIYCVRLKFLNTPIITAGSTGFSK